MKGKDAQLLCTLGRFELPRLLTAAKGQAAQFTEALAEAAAAERVAVVVSPVLSDGELSHVAELTGKLKNLVFAAAEDIAAVPAAMEESRRTAISHNFSGAPELKAQLLADDSYGISSGKLAALGLARISEAQKALLKNGGADLLLAFGVRELPETADGVKVVRVKAAF